MRIRFKKWARPELKASKFYRLAVILCGGVSLLPV